MSVRHNNHLAQLQRNQAVFLSILPKIINHAEYAFRYLRSHDFDDAVAESVGISWKWFIRLVDQGKNPTKFPSVLAGFATRAVKAGRRLCGQESPKDTLSPTAQRRRGFVVTKLPDFSTLESNPLEAALVDNTKSPVPDQVHFRLDFPSWERRLSQRTRRITRTMALGHRTKDIAAQFRISQSRVSQLRQELYHSWLAFLDDQESGDTSSSNVAA